MPVDDHRLELIALVLESVVGKILQHRIQGTAHRESKLRVTLVLEQSEHVLAVIDGVLDHKLLNFWIQTSSTACVFVALGLHRILRYIPCVLHDVLTGSKSLSSLSTPRTFGPRTPNGFSIPRKVKSAILQTPNSSVVDWKPLAPPFNHRSDRNSLLALLRVRRKSEARSTFLRGAS